jgi:hypothetical protein
MTITVRPPADGSPPRPQRRSDAPRPRVLFLVKHRSAYGCDAPLTSGLYNSARMACEMVKRLGIAAEIEHCIDGDFIEAATVRFRASHVIIEAFWVTPAKFAELARVLPGVRFIVRNHSETPFLANEGIAFEWALAYLAQDVRVAPNAPRMRDELRFLAGSVRPDLDAHGIADLVPFLPNAYMVREEPPRALDADKAAVDVGCFGAIRPMKNQVLQAIAAMRFADRLGKRLVFHINADRLENGGEPVLKSLRAIFAATDHKLREHPWYDHDAFLSLMLSMDVVCQVSFSETFCIVAADAASEGVPIVCSPEIPWASSLFTADPTDSRDIAEKMFTAYSVKLQSPAFNPALEGIRAYNRATRARWAEVFGA